MDLEQLLMEARFGSKKVKKAAIKSVTGSMRKADQLLANLDTVGFVTKGIEGAFKRVSYANCLDSSYTFAQEYLKESMFSKYMDGTTAPASVCWENALVKMIASEERCKTLNLEGLSNDKVPCWVVDDIMQRARAIIGRALGAKPDYSMFATAAFGSGATTCRTRANGDPYFKYNTVKNLDVTTGAYKYAVALIDQTPLWKSGNALGNLRIKRGNMLFSVNKKTDEYRFAFKEPGMNALLQRPVGVFIRKQLKKLFRIDLRNQTLNQRLAKVGSITNALSTLDLSSASDSISQRLIFELLPIDWVRFLDELRSPEGFFPDGPSSTTGEWKTMEKHSTMGNGYTFELESLIFYAISMACRNHCKVHYALPAIRHEISVYGDDIICPSYSSSLTVEMLTYCGFSTNKDKSFTHGPFRESCGKHYHLGVDVTPFYVRKPINTVPRMIWFLNALKRWGAIDGIADPVFYDLWLELKRKYIPREFWGGSNSHAITSLCTIDEPRFSVVSTIPKRKINGLPAVLRCFQYQSLTVAHNHVKWLEVFELDTYSPVPSDFSDEDLMAGVDIVRSNVSMDSIPDLRRREEFGAILNDSISFEEVYYPAEIIRDTYKQRRLPWFTYRNGK